MCSTVKPSQRSGSTGLKIFAFCFSAGFLVFGVFSTFALAETFFTGLGPDTTADAVSGDGSVVVGAEPYVGNYQVGPGFRWTPTNGLESLPEIPGLEGVPIEPRAASADGSVIVGSFNLRAFRWTAESGYTTVSGGDAADGLGCSSCIARDVSADGSVVVGSDALGGQGFLWTQTDGKAYP